MKVAVIGNGFDIRHDLETTYKSFLDYVDSRESEKNLADKNFICKYLIKRNKSRSWIDLENDLLLFLEDLSNLGNNLSYSDYSANYKIDKADFNKNIHRINFYESMQSMQFSFFKGDIYNRAIHIHIISDLDIERIQEYAALLPKSKMLLETLNREMFILPENSV